MMRINNSTQPEISTAYCVLPTAY